MSSLSSHKEQLKQEFIHYINHFMFSEKNINGVLLVFKASWCVPCKSMAKQLEEIETLLKNKGVILIPIDIDDMKDIYGNKASFFSFLKQQRIVSGVPSLLLYLKNGEYCNVTSNGPNKYTIYPDFFCEGVNKYHFEALVKTIKNITVL